jgi:ABC-2 type transport system permease protein
MKNIGVIYRHEIFLLIISPATYIAGFLFLMLFWYLYTWHILPSLPSEDLPTTSLFQYFWIPVIFMVPLLTMKTLAEERRLGTLETLLTTPTTTPTIVIGKFWAAYTVYMTLWLLALLYPALSQLEIPYGRTNFNFLEPAPLLGGYLFIAVSGTMHIAAGIFASSLTRSQLVASLLSFGILFIIVLGEYLFFPQIEIPKQMAESWHHTLDYLSTFRHLEDFSRGILDTRPFILYLTSTAIFLGGAVLIIEQKANR